ncbi:hypothetical protein [Cupriavidus sp. YR651]|uniref:hypothetical protein n=1 Tax=Cupriavidus sp. YR651 TaxID=1855315 RepID=UPI0021014CB0|nr:hypothetical protein [Cupriavidus sp. YR651]
MDHPEKHLWETDLNAVNFFTSAELISASPLPALSSQPASRAPAWPPHPQSCPYCPVPQPRQYRRGCRRALDILTLRRTGSRTAVPAQGFDQIIEMLDRDTFFHAARSRAEVMVRNRADAQPLDLIIRNKIGMRAAA